MITFTAALTIHVIILVSLGSSLPLPQEGLTSTYLAKRSWCKRLWSLARPVIIFFCLGRGSVWSLVRIRPRSMLNMEAVFIPMGLVALSEIGDKTQLLALLLAVKFKRPVPIVLGIIAATLGNHFLAGILGKWFGATVRTDILSWVLGLSFIAMAIWTLIPDKPSAFEAKSNRLGVFGITLLTFFMAEMGDKTQMATVAFAAKYSSSLYAVVAGTTLGMLIADVPVVFLGEKIMQKISLKWIQRITAISFAVLGLLVLMGFTRPF